jgi:hypothetical protein
MRKNHIKFCFASQFRRPTVPQCGNVEKQVDRPMSNDHSRFTGHSFHHVRLQDRKAVIGSTKDNSPA